MKIKCNFSDDEPIPATIAVESLMDVTEEDVAGLLGFELGNPQLTQFFNNLVSTNVIFLF